MSAIDLLIFSVVPLWSVEFLSQADDGIDVQNKALIKNRVLKQIG